MLHSEDIRHKTLFSSAVIDDPILSVQARSALRSRLRLARSAALLGDSSGGGADKFTRWDLLLGLSNHLSVGRVGLFTLLPLPCCLIIFHFCHFFCLFVRGEGKHNRRVAQSCSFRL
eukprot:GHVN01063474.1.p1 GENE.GHVN01063474.1~~GHVN01063474.1.p1  ORF type:complete len:117 (-),score=8.75 GHVN01063474.1:318-668(-)